jgi:hypothetical protein
MTMTAHSPFTKRVRFGHIGSGEAAGRLGVADHGQLEKVHDGMRVDA